MTRGIVKFYKDDRGWGAISSPELPDGQDAWVHFSSIEGTGYRSLAAGDVVECDIEPAQQDSFRFRALRVRRLSAGPAPTLRRTGDRVVVVPDGTPDTPLLGRRPHDGGSGTPG